MTEDEFYDGRCPKSDLLRGQCACCRGYAAWPTPPDPFADETPQMQPLGTQADRATTRCPGCLEELQLGESTTRDPLGARTHSECAT